jgi:hypothetical protein
MPSPPATASPSKPARAKVTVVDANTGATLKDAAVEIWSIHSGRTDRSGTWTSKVFRSGDYDLKVFLPGFGPVPNNGLAPRELNAITHVDFPPLTFKAPITLITVSLVQVLPRALITVVDPTQNNEPVKGANLEIIEAPDRKAVTDRNGSAVLLPPSLGTFRIRLTKPFYGPPFVQPPQENPVQLTVVFNATSDMPLTIQMASIIGKVRSSNISVGSKPFVAWFNKDFRPRIPADHPTIKQGKNPAKTFPAIIDTASFANIFDHCDELFAPELTLEEFVAIFLIMYNETGGTLRPISELAPKKEPVPLRYFFEPGTKLSYNTRGNRKAGDLLRDRGVLTDPDEIAAWNQTKPYPNPPPGTDLAAAAIECDFFKYRGRGLIGTTFFTGYVAEVVPVLKTTGHVPADKDPKQALDDMTEAELDQIINTDRSVFTGMVKQHLTSIRGTFDGVNQRNFRAFGLEIAGHGATSYASLYEFRCNALLDEMKKDGIVLQ